MADIGSDFIMEAIVVNRNDIRATAVRRFPYAEPSAGPRQARPTPARIPDSAPSAPRSVEDSVGLEFDEYIGLEEEVDADDGHGRQRLRQSQLVGDEFDTGHEVAKLLRC